MITKARYGFVLDCLARMHAVYLKYHILYDKEVLARESLERELKDLRHGNKMSMNLKCKEVELWQTPTHITYMCYSNGDGGWQGILYRYSEWIKNGINHTFPSKESADDWHNQVKEHLSQFEDKNALTFFIV
jgi:hypothetical protein